MSEQITINGLLCVDENGRYDLVGWDGGDFPALYVHIREVSWIRDRENIGCATQVYEIEIEVPRPLLNRLSLSIRESSVSSTPKVEDAFLRRVPVPRDPPVIPQNEPIVPSNPPIVSQTGPSEPPPEAAITPRTAVTGNDADGNADGEGPTIMQRIEERIREAGGSLPWTAVEVNRPVSITHDVFRAAIAKRFLITKRGRGETVSLRDS